MLRGTYFGGASGVPGGKTWVVTLGGLPGEGTTGEGVGGDLGGCTGGHGWCVPGGKSNMFAAVAVQPVPPSDVELELLVLDGCEHLILEP